MINEQLRKQLEERVRDKITGLKAKNPDCNFSIVVYDSGTREGEVVIKKEKPGGEEIDYVIGSAQEH